MSSGLLIDSLWGERSWGVRADSFGQPHATTGGQRLRRIVP